MTETVTIMLLGEPVAWRHRTSPRSPGIRYLPKKQRDVSATLRLAAQQAMLECDRPMFDEPVRLELLAVFAIPASWSQRKRQQALAGQSMPGKKPDLSNTLKLVEDSLNGVVFRDDCLICEHHTRKIYGGTPRIKVTISLLHTFAATSADRLAPSAAQPTKCP